MNTTMKMISAALLIGGLMSSTSLTAQTTSKTIVPLPLSLEIDGHEFRVSGGQPGDLCGIVIGFERASIPLPSGSLLLVNPVAFLGLGRFDALGEFRVVIGWDGKMLSQIEYHFQGFALQGESQELVTSDRETLDFRNVGVVDQKD